MAVSQLNNVRDNRVDSSYVSRMVNLTALAPDIVAAILDEAFPADVTLFDLAVEPQAVWEEQKCGIGICDAATKPGNVGR